MKCEILNSEAGGDGERKAGGRLSMRKMNSFLQNL